MSAPDLIGEVYGLRAWIHSSDGRLGDWVPGTNVASCRNGLPHLSPAEDCGCGLYAYHRLHGFRRNGAYGDVIGLVRGWGRISVAEAGWRAQYAEIVAIADNLGAEQIAKRYEVPVLPVNWMDAYARTHGVPSELCPNRRRPEPPLLALPDVKSPARSRDHGEIAWALSCAGVSVGAIGALAFGAAVLPVIILWALVMMVCITVWWYDQ